MWFRIIKPLLERQRNIWILELNLHLQSFPCQAGHSKWANIRHTKALKDGQKSVVFTKLARQIRLAIQEGGSCDPVLNKILRNVIDEALQKNMPMATIQNNIKKSQQSEKRLNKYQMQIQYRQKVFIVCILYTDNITALKQEMSAIIRKSGAKYVEALHLFKDVGIIETLLELKENNITDLNDRVTEDAIECDAEDVEVINADSGAVKFFCNVLKLPVLSKSLQARGYQIVSSEQVFVANNVVELNPEELKEYDTFLQKLRALGGVEDIYDNVDIKHLS